MPRPLDARPIVISRQLLAEVVDHLRSALPCEGCGLLAESIIDGERRAHAFFPGTNVDHSPHRFTMDLRAVVDALRTIDDRGWQLGAIVHSHPTGPATPSPTDLAEAYYPEAAMLIVGFENSDPIVRAWRLSPVGRGTEVEVRVVQSSGSPSECGPSAE